MKTYPGRLDMVSSGDAGFRVKVYVGDERVEIVSFESEQWSWPLVDMTVQRAGSSRFLLALGDERVYFTPDEPLRFAAGTDDLAEEDAERTGWLRRRIEAARDIVPAETPVGEAEFVQDFEPRVTQKRRKKHDHEWDEATSAGVLRRRCVSCGHVSIDITGFVSEFDLAAGEGERSEPVSIAPKPSLAEAV